MSAHRLPPAIRPLHYALHLKADPADEDFEGTVTIDVELKTPSRTIEMHAVGLSIGAANVTQGQTQIAESATEGDRLRVTVPKPLQAGTATIILRYTGKVRHDMAGLYLSQDGQRRCLATQCEATDARSIVPCWDEPEHKASWQWTVTAPQGLTVLTNGPTTAVKEGKGTTTHHFAPTPPMSSYLIACCIGDFAATPVIDARGHAMRVWAMQGQEQHGDHGNDLAARMLPWYEDYFGQPYAFGKYDQIAVPSFAFGAMENAGLVLFRPSLVLLDEKTASWDDKRHVCLVVAHEFAHMWFGNLVTMAWWDDLWLNEAFAEWIAHRCAHAMDPDLDVWVSFRQRAAGALATDSLASTHAIYHHVKTPEEAQEMFDAVTYGKGSAVMRMLEAYLGEGPFQRGLQAYMAAFAFDNAQGKDLWHHLGEASGEDVAGIMGDWVTQAGHPTVSVERDASTLRLTQRRTTSSPDAEVPDTVWRIPLVVRYDDATGVHEHRHLMGASKEEITLPGRELRWVWPNADDGGFYRSDLGVAALQDTLANVAALHPAERVALLRDLWNQVQAGRRDVQAFLDAFEAVLDPADHYEVVEATVGMARMLDGLLQGHEEQSALRAWLAQRMRPGWDVEAMTPPERQRKAAILRALGIAHDPAGIEAARRLGSSERVDPSSIDAQLAATAIGVEAMTGDATTLETHLATYAARRDGAFSPQEVERYVYALPAFRDAPTVAKVLELLASQGVAAQAEGPILRAMLASPYVGHAAWDHLHKHWDTTSARLGEAWLAIIVEACGELPTDLAEDVIAFWDERLQGHATQSYTRAKERLRQRAQLEQRILGDVKVWAGRLGQGARAATPSVAR